jgi:hypothetical protein
LGLAVLASLAAAQTDAAARLGATATAALNSGYHHAFAVGAGFAILAAVLGFTGFARAKVASAPQAGGHAM